MNNPTHIVTFFFGSTGQQSQHWNEQELMKKDKRNKPYSMLDLAKDVKHDMMASSFLIEKIK